MVNICGKYRDLAMLFRCVLRTHLETGLIEAKIHLKLLEMLILFIYQWTLHLQLHRLHKLGCLLFTLNIDWAKRANDVSEIPNPENLFCLPNIQTREKTFYSITRTKLTITLGNNVLRFHYIFDFFRSQVNGFCYAKWKSRYRSFDYGKCEHFCGSFFLNISIKIIKRKKGVLHVVNIAGISIYV